MLPLSWEHLLFEMLRRELGGKLAGGGFDQNGSVRKDNGGYAAVSAIHVKNKLGSLVVLFDVYIFVGYAVRLKPALRHTAISTPGGSIHLNYLIC